jgi:hypothetical protein
LRIKFDRDHKEQFWETIQYDRTHNQEQKYEIHQTNHGKRNER